MHTFWPMDNIKYLYMSRTQRHIKSQLNTINEVSNAIIQKPTNAAFVSKEIMETYKEKRNLRQTGKIVYFKGGEFIKIKSSEMLNELVLQDLNK